MLELCFSVGVARSIHLNLDVTNNADIDGNILKLVINCRAPSGYKKAAAALARAADRQSSSPAEKNLSPPHDRVAEAETGRPIGAQGKCSPPRSQTASCSSPSAQKYPPPAAASARSRAEIREVGRDGQGRRGSGAAAGVRGRGEGGRRRGRAPQGLRHDPPRRRRRALLHVLLRWVSFDPRLSAPSLFLSYGAGYNSRAVYACSRPAFTVAACSASFLSLSCWFCANRRF
jgi:hypothetical protein